MEVTTTDIDGAAEAAGTVVVIDAIRAFTTATEAAAAGALRIVCVEGLEEAHDLRRRLGSGTVLMGEERGRRPDGFDLGNEPGGPTAGLVGGRTVVQRTSNGTRGLARARAATHLLAAGAVNLSATARWIAAHAPDGPATLVTTGSTSEDGAVAAQLAVVLAGGELDGPALRTAVRDAADEHRDWWRGARDRRELAAFHADVELCAEVDRHPLALVVRRDADVAPHPVLVAERA